MRAHLTVDFIEQQFNLYRNTRQRVKAHLKQVQQSGYNTVRLVGDGDVADVCRLTCLEQGISITTDKEQPVIEVDGLKWYFTWSQAMKNKRHILVTGGAGFIGSLVNRRVASCRVSSFRAG